MAIKYNFSIGHLEQGESILPQKEIDKIKAQKKFIDDIYNSGIEIVITDLPGIDIIDADYEEVKPKELPQKSTNEGAGV